MIATRLPICGRDECIRSIATIAAQTESCVLIGGKSQKGHASTRRDCLSSIDVWRDDVVRWYDECGAAQNGRRKRIDDAHGHDDGLTQTDVCERV